jgi:hypothetical protein
MAESTKHVPNLNIKSFFSILKTRKATAFAYAFMLAFVSLTVFLAFFPSSNVSSPWFNNIFTTKTSISGSYKSQLSNIFSFFFHNTTTSSSSSSFSNTFSSSTFSNTSRSSKSNTSQSSNTTTKTFKATPFGNKTQNPLNQTSHQVSDETKHQKKTNQTANKDVVLSNNQTGLKVKDEIHMMESLMKCDFFDGKWIKDESYPFYEPGSCNLIDEQFNCINNGRPDKDYQKYKWKPNGCTLPRLENFDEFHISTKFFLFV